MCDKHPYPYTLRANEVPLLRNLFYEAWTESLASKAESGGVGAYVLKVIVCRFSQGLCGGEEVQLIVIELKREPHARPELMAPGDPLTRVSSYVETSKKH